MRDALVARKACVARADAEADSLVRHSSKAIVARRFVDTLTPQPEESGRVKVDLCAQLLRFTHQRIPSFHFALDSTINAQAADVRLEWMGKLEQLRRQICNTLFVSAAVILMIGVISGPRSVVRLHASPRLAGALLAILVALVPAFSGFKMDTLPIDLPERLFQERQWSISRVLHPATETGGNDSLPPRHVGSSGGCSGAANAIHGCGPTDPHAVLAERLRTTDSLVRKLGDDIKNIK